jgi:glycosyltransferase involved in cell wall biosynthesis
MACRKLKFGGMEFQARIVGDPILWSSHYLLTLKAECSGADVVLERLDGRPIPYSDLDVVVVASTLPEACPLVVLEAMADGCVVVAAEIGGIPELITHGIDGLLVPTRSVDGLADGIRTALENPTAAVALGQGAHARARSEFSIDVAVRRVMLALESWRRVDGRAS